jgi:hypothetical protein
MDDSEPLDIGLPREPPSVDEAVAKLRLRLRDWSLAELEERGLVEWDWENGVVKRGAQFEEGEPD